MKPIQRGASRQKCRVLSAGAKSSGGRPCVNISTPPLMCRQHPQPEPGYRCAVLGWRSESGRGSRGSADPATRSPLAGAGSPAQFARPVVAWGSSDAQGDQRSGTAEGAGDAEAGLAGVATGLARRDRQVGRVRQPSGLATVRGGENCQQRRGASAILCASCAQSSTPAAQPCFPH